MKISYGHASQTVGHERGADNVSAGRTDGKRTPPRRQTAQTVYLHSNVKKMKKKAVDKAKEELSR